VTSVAQLAADPIEIRRAIDVFFVPGDVVEVRIPRTARDGTCSGYFDNFDLLARALAHWSGKAPAVYYTLNPVRHDLLARAANRIRTRVRETTSDADILCRRWMLIDSDPVRPAGISSTDQEHELALARACAIREWLRSQGWPESILGNSGNGGHLFPRIDLPNDADSQQLVQSVLEAIAHRFDDEKVKIDRSVHNAARIVKAYGTLAAKGENFNGGPGLDPRPHRLARLL
jgi:hypothetical protein